MSERSSNKKSSCQVCGGATKLINNLKDAICCPFCGFKKIHSANTMPNDDILFADDVNKFFKDKFMTLKQGETFSLCVPVSRFYKTPSPIAGQINFFRSKNIMYLIEQHGFQMVSRKSRFSTSLNLVIRKV